jgi:hypothetical protein
MEDKQKINIETKIILKDDPIDKDMIIVIRNGKPIGKCTRFNNGFTKDGYPLPLE